MNQYKYFKVMLKHHPEIVEIRDKSRILYKDIKHLKAELNAITRSYDKKNKSREMCSNKLENEYGKSIDKYLL